MNQPTFLPKTSIPQIALLAAIGATTAGCWTEVAMVDPADTDQPSAGVEQADPEQPPIESTSPNPLARAEPQEPPAGASAPQASEARPPEEEADRYATPPSSLGERLPWQPSEPSEPDASSPPDALFAGVTETLVEETTPDSMESEQEDEQEGEPEPSQSPPGGSIFEMLEPEAPDAPPIVETPTPQPEPDAEPTGPSPEADRYAPESTPTPAVEPPAEPPVQAQSDLPSEAPVQAQSDPAPFRFPWDEDPPADPTAPPAEAADTAQMDEPKAEPTPAETLPPEDQPDPGPIADDVAATEPGQTRSVSISVSNTRRMAWALGGKIGVAYLPALGASNDPQSRWEIEALCEALGLPSAVGDAEAVDPPTSDEPGSDTSITELLGVGRGIGGELAQKHGREHAALLEVALKSTAAVSLCERRPDLNKPLAGAIESASGRAGIPDAMWRPLVEDLRTGATPDVIRRAADTMYEEVGDWLDGRK